MKVVWVFAPGPLLLMTYPMETNTTQIELLLASAEQYNRANLELLKLKSVDKTASIASTLFSRALLTMALFIFTMMLTIAISFWLGELLGAVYFGFLSVASVYAMIAIILFVCHALIKKRAANFIVLQMLN
jgi:hypothetical protein